MTLLVSVAAVQAALPVAASWFTTTAEATPPGCGYSLYRTREIHETGLNDGVHANSFLLKGPDADLLVDVGFGFLSLAAHLEQQHLLGDSARPLLVFATHEHFDHAGGLSGFAASGAQTIMGAADADAVEYGNGTLTCAIEIATKYAIMPRLYWDASPFEDFDAALQAYTVQSRVDRRVRFGDVISLGGNASFQVLELPGHTPGSVGLYNANGTHELFTGDAIYDATLYDFCVDSDKSAYRATMELLRNLPVSLAYPGHEETISHARLLELIDCYLGGINPCPHLS